MTKIFDVLELYSEITFARPHHDREITRIPPTSCGVFRAILLYNRPTAWLRVQSMEWAY